MKYILLRNGVGTLQTWTYEVTYDVVRLEFIDSYPESFVTIVKNNGESRIYPIKDGVCNVPAKQVKGSFDVFVVYRDKRWKCDKLKVEELNDGGYMVSPEETDIPRKISELLMLCQVLQGNIDHLAKEIVRLEKRIEKITDGYDFT